MKKVKIVSFILLIVLSLVLTACVPSKKDTNTSSNNSSNNNAGEDGPIPVRIFTPLLSWDGKFETEFNTFTKHVEEKFNIKITWEFAPQDAAKEKQQLALASGDYPDAFLSVTWLDGISKVDAQKYGKEGVFLPLNDLINDHAPNIVKAMQDIPYLEKGITAPDGNIYALPQINECYHCSRYGKMWMNTDWLEKLNLDMPTNTAEFRDVLRAFKANDPNGNGKNDEIPLSGETTEIGNSPNIFLMNAFIHNNGKDNINVEDGELYLAAMRPEWKEGLKYINSLYEEGLIDTGTYTQNMEALKQIGSPEGEAVLGASAANHLAVFMDLKNENSASYNVVPPIEGPQGAKFNTSDYGSISNFTFAITEKAKGAKAEALIKLADYLYTEEGTVRATKGIEGVDWKFGEEDDIDLKGNQAKYARVPQDPNKEEEDEENKIYNTWGEKGPIMLTREIRDATATAIDEYSPEGYERRLYNATLSYDGNEPKEIFLAGSAWVEPEEAEEVSLLQININKYINENMVQFITGTKNIDSEWDNYIAGFKKLKVDRYLEIYQKAYDLEKE
ncbi:extracellular solute-binding protein [Lederbergia wuyishanensis]|uniref:Aldouronate transport system substrate-binding protein n=1 Tax=Lederbergia wuyishanensis TaxID=1347903 RepID=A0ABU0D436_9BACI|nr:extracellular solute-binding protein [Lederbergia wuyishanensis]MCJ8008251.1 extracellular solute-binding protein [Lederbergia wuyishanensis]MDQ0343160.1 putative aldouronate transport system substrate-binding protein [Lederbergia wuyishanensis]